MFDYYEFVIASNPEKAGMLVQEFERLNSLVESLENRIATLEPPTGCGHSGWCDCVR